MYSIAALRDLGQNGPNEKGKTAERHEQTDEEAQNKLQKDMYACICHTELFNTIQLHWH